MDMYIEDVDHRREDDRAVFALLASVLGLVLVATFAYFLFWTETDNIADTGTTVGLSVNDASTPAPVLQQ